MLQCGIPQGSCLGPLLFSHSTSDMPYILVQDSEPNNNCLQTYRPTYLLQRQSSQNSPLSPLKVIIKLLPVTSTRVRKREH